MNGGVRIESMRLKVDLKRLVFGWLGSSKGIRSKCKGRAVYEMGYGDVDRT